MLGLVVRHFVDGDRHDFLTHVATQRGTDSRETARWDASTVLSTLADGIAGGELNQLLSQLPSGYAPLFGHPELA